MTELKESIVFDKILEPVFPLIKEAQNKIAGDSNDYKLSLLPFTVNLLFAIICRKGGHPIEFLSREKLKIFISHYFNSIER